MIKYYLKRFFSSSKQINEHSVCPYKFGGLSNFNSFLSQRNLIDRDYSSNNDSLTRDPNFFPYFRTRLRINAHLEKLLNSQYESFAEELVNVLNKNPVKNKSESMLDWKLKSELDDLKHQMKNLKDSNLNSKNINYSLITNQKSKNRFYIDKIFLHKGYGNENDEIGKIENVLSKNLVIFHYKGEKTKMKVRLSVFANISNHLIVQELKTKEEDDVIKKFKIYNDEWHHIIFQFDDNVDNLDYLKIFQKFTFPSVMNNIIDFFIEGKLIKKEVTYRNLKIVDFDYFLLGNPLTENETSKSEFYFIKNNY